MSSSGSLNNLLRLHKIASSSSFSTYKPLKPDANIPAWFNGKKDDDTPFWMSRKFVDIVLGLNGLLRDDTDFENAAVGNKEFIPIHKRDRGVNIDDIRMFKQQYNNSQGAPFALRYNEHITHY